MRRPWRLRSRSLSCQPSGFRLALVDKSEADRSSPVLVETRGPWWWRSSASADTACQHLLLRGYPLSSACRCRCACRVVCPLFWICFFRAYHPWSRVRALGWSLPGSAARVSEPCRLPCLRPRVSRVMYVSLLVQITVGCRPGCNTWPPGWPALSGLCLAQVLHPVPTYSNLVYARIDVPAATSAAMQQLSYHGPSLHAGLLHIHARLSRGAWCGETHTYGKQYASDHSLTHPLTHSPTHTRGKREAEWFFVAYGTSSQIERRSLSHTHASLTCHAQRYDLLLLAGYAYAGEERKGATKGCCCESSAFFVFSLHVRSSPMQLAREVDRARCLRIDRFVIVSRWLEVRNVWWL